MTTILITGSRTWSDRQAIRWALESWSARLTGPITLLSGACPRGADLIAEQEAARLGMEIVRMPADWSRPCGVNCHHGGRGERDVCRAAGNIRNSEMVATGPDLCLGFPTSNGTGTQDCLRKAVRAGICTFLVSGVGTVRRLSPESVPLPS